jgi:hypothetical protein
MNRSRHWALVALMLIFICAGLAACTNYSSPGPSNGTPAPASTSGGY